MSLVANITHDSIDLVPIKFNTSFILNAPQFGCFAWVDFSLARISCRAWPGSTVSVNGRRNAVGGADEAGPANASLAPMAGSRWYGDGVAPPDTVAECSSRETMEGAGCFWSSAWLE